MLNDSTAPNYRDDSISIKRVLKQAGVVHNTKPQQNNYNWYIPSQQCKRSTTFKMVAHRNIIN